jgi:hypothetical protein
MNPLPIKTKEQRLVVYEKCLKYALVYKENDLPTQGLCIELFTQSGRSFLDEHPEANIQFPEFGELFGNDYSTNQINDNTKYRELYETDPVEWRIKVLKECIKMCKK